MSDIQKSYVVPFAKDVVFTAWTSSGTIIAPATSMDILPELGGYYRLLMETPEFTSRNEGVFLIFEPGQHIRYTWQWNGDGEVTEIDVRFQQVPDGTRIDISHSGFASPESHAMHDTGWDSYIAGFTALLASNPEM